MYSNNNKNIHTHNGASQDNTAVLHSNEEFSGCHLNSTNTPTSSKSAVPKQSTTSVLRQWRRPDAVVDKHASAKYTKVDNNPTSEYSMYSQPQHSTAVPAYLSHGQYGDSTRYSKQDARVPDGVVKYGTSGQYYQQDGSSYPGQSTPPLAHAKITSGYGEGHNYTLGNQKVSQNYPYQMVNQTYHQKIQQHDSKNILHDEPNAYCLKSGPYPAQNRVAQPNGHPNGQPNVAYSLSNPLDRRLSPQEPSQSYYVNKSTCLSQEFRHGRPIYGVDKTGTYAQVYGPSYLAQKPNLLSPQDQKCREYRQIVHNPKKSPPFPILEQRLSAEGSFYPDYGPGGYAHHKYGPVMLPGAGQKNYLNTSGPKFPPEDIIPSSYAKYYPPNKVTYEQNHYLLQMNQMQTRLNPNLFARSSELPRDVAYMDQTSRTHPKRCLQYNAMEANQFGPKSSNVNGQKPTKIVTYGSVQDQRMGEHPSGEYFRSYSKGQSVIQSSGKMQVDSYNITGRTEQESYAYSPPLIQQNSRPALAQYPNNYRPSMKTNEVSSGNISPRRTFQENMPVVVIPSQCIGLPKVSPPQYSLPGQEYSQMYQNYLPKESYYPKPGNVQYRNEHLVKQPVHVSRNILPSYPSAQYQHSSPEGPRSIYGQHVVQQAAPDYREYQASSVVRSPYGKKEVDIGKSLKEYLESWEDDEDIVTNLPDVVLCNNIPADKQKHVSFAEPIAEARANSSAVKPSEDDTVSQPLYILDSTNISSEALSQYLHIQQIDHLPANIKGYYKLPGVAAPVEMSGEPLEKPLRAVAEQILENSKDQVADLPRKQSEELARVVDNAESTVGKLETQAQLAEDYSKTRELNLLEATALCIPEITAELTETSAENASPQDYSVNKRGTTEMTEASGFQECLPQDFSIARKSEQLTITAEDTVEQIAQHYSITKPKDKLLEPENTIEASVIQANTPEDYSDLLQEDVALNLSTNRSKSEDNSEDSHLLREILREADSSIIEESTKTKCASKLQAVLQRSNEELEESKVSSSNTKNSQPVPYGKTFSAQLNEDDSACIEATARIEEYLEIEHRDSKFNEPAVIQIHTASVIVQNTFFDDKSGAKTLSEPVQKSNQEVENDGRCSESDPTNLQVDVSCITSHSESPQQLTNHIGSNQDGHSEETVAEISAKDEPRTYSSLAPCNKSRLSSDLPKPCDNPCYQSFEPSDVEQAVKTYRKKSLLHDYNREKMEEDSSERSSSESSAEDEDDYTRQRTENEDANNERKYETSASEDCEVFTSDEDDEEFDQEMAEGTNKRSRTNKETTQEAVLDQSTSEEQNIQDESTPGTPNDHGTDNQDETSQSTSTKDTDESAQSTAEVKSTSEHDETSQSTVEDSNLEDSSTERDQGTIRIEELPDKQESTTKLIEQSGSTTGKDGTTPGDDTQSTTDEESTIIQAEAKEIGTTESVLHQSIDEVVQYKESTIDNQQVLEEKHQENSHNNSPLHQEIATDSIGSKEDCKNLACSNKTVQQSSQDNASNNSSTSLQAHNLATCNNCRESVQDLAASQLCNKVATGNNYQQETEREISGEYVDLHQDCKMDAIIEDNNDIQDNHEDITSVDNQITLCDRREATSSSQCWSEESEDTTDCNQLEQSEQTDLHSEESSRLSTSTAAESEDCNLQTNPRESEDTDTKVVVDKEECNNATFPYAEKDGRRSSLADRDLHVAETECNSDDEDSDLDVDLQAEDLTLQSEEASLLVEEASLQTEASTLQTEDPPLLSEDPTVESEDLTRYSEDTLLQTNTTEAEIILEDLASLPVEELKTPTSLMDNEDNSSALSDHSSLSSKSDDYLIDNIISIDNNKQLAADSFELEMENIFKNIPQDPVYPRSTIEDCIQAEESIDHVKLQTMDDSATRLETDNSKRMVAETSGQCGSSFEEHSAEMCDDLLTTDDAIPEELVQPSRVTVPAVTLPANLLPADNCLVIYSAADDFVVLQEPETVSVETIIEEQDIEELVDEQLDTEPEVRAVSVEHVEELIARQMSTADEQIIDSIHANPLDKELNKHSVDAKQEIVDNPTKLKVNLKQTQEPKNHTEIPVTDTVICEELQPTVEEIQVHLTAETQLQLVSEIEIDEQCLQDVKHEIKEESPTEQQQRTEDVVTIIEEFKEEIVNLEIHPEQVKIEDETVKERSENVDFREELPDYKKNIDNTDDIIATIEDKQPEERVKKDLLTTYTESDEKMKVKLKIEDNISQESNTKEELEEGELSDQSDDWDELFGSVKLQAPPISQEKKLLFARRKKNLEKLKAKLLLAQQMHKSAGKFTEELIQSSSAQHKPVKGILQGISSEVHSAEMPESNENKSNRGSNLMKLCLYSSDRSSINSASSLPNVDEDSSCNRTVNPSEMAKPSSNFGCNPDDGIFPNTSTNTNTLEDASSVNVVQRLLSSRASSSQESKSSSIATTSADTLSKSTVVEPASKDPFQLPPMFKHCHASVEDKELFINPENPQYQSTNTASLDLLASRKRSQSYTDYYSPKIEFTAPKRRYSVLEMARPLRKPIINLDEISQNISQVLKRLDSTENQRKLTYKQRTESKETSERAENERQSRENNIKVQTNDKCEPKRGLKKLDQFKLYEKMVLQKSLQVLPVKLYEDEECVVNDNSALSVLQSSKNLVQSLDSDQTFGTNTYPTPALRKGAQLEATTSAKVFKPLELVDSAHHLAKPLQSNTPAVVVKPTVQFVSSQLFVTSASEVTNMEADLVQCPEGIASSHHLRGGGQNDPLADVPSKLVDPILVLSKVSYNPRTRKICGVKNGQAKQKAKIAIGSESAKSSAHVAGKENSQQKQIHLEESKEDKNNLSETQKDNVTVENRIEKAGSEEQSPLKMLGKQAEDRLKQKGRNEDRQAKIKGADGRQKVGISNSDCQRVLAKKEDSKMLEANKEDSQKVVANKEDSQKVEAKNEGSQTLEAKKEDSQKLQAKKEDSQKLQAKKEDSQRPQVTDEDCPTIVERRKEDLETEERKENSQLEVQRREDENPRIKTNKDKREECIKPEKNTSCIVQSDKNNSGDNIFRDTVLKSSTSVFTVETSTAKSSTAIIDTSTHKPDESTVLQANSSSNEAVLSNTATVSSNVPTLNMKVEPTKLQVDASNARRQLQERQRTAVSVKSGKLNAIIASLQASRSAKAVASSFERMKGKKDPSPSVNRGSSSGDLQESLAGSTAATVDQPALVKGKTSIGDELVSVEKHVSPESELAPAVNQIPAQVDQQSAIVNQCTAIVQQLIPPGQQVASANGTKVPLADPHTAIQECSPKFSNTSSTTAQSSTSAKAYTGPAVSPLLHNMAYNNSNVGSTAYKDASKVEAVSSNAPSVSVIVQPTIAKRRNDVKKLDGIDTKLANTFRLTEYTKSYIKLKMSEEMDASIANGLKQSDQVPVKQCSQQLKRKLPNCETDSTISTAPDKKVKINLQDYRNRKQHGVCPVETRIATGHCKNDNGSFDDCLGEVVDDFMTVIEANEQYSIANEIGSEFRRSSNLGMEIYMDDSMELIPGNEEIVHTSTQEEDVRENSGTEELESENDRININPIHRPTTGARKMRIRMLCTPDSAIDQARFEDISFPGPSKIEDDPEMNSLPKTATTARETNTNTLVRQRIKSKGEMKMYRPKRRKKRFRNLYTTDEDDDTEVPNDLTPARVQCREEIHDSSGASPEDYSHLVSVEPASKKHVVRGEESQETSASSASGGAVDDLGPLSRRQGYQQRSHKRSKAKNPDSERLPSSSDSSKAFSRKLEYKCHINLNALGRNCNMLTADPVQPSTSSKLGLKLTLKSVRKQNAPDSTSTTASSRRNKHGKRKVPRTEHSAYSVSTSVANDKVPKVIIKRNGSGYCAVSRDVSTNPIWQPIIRVRRQRFIESLVRVQGGSVP